VQELLSWHEQWGGAGERHAGEARHVLPGVEREAVVQVGPCVSDVVAALEDAVRHPVL